MKRLLIVLALVFLVAAHLDGELPVQPRQRRREFNPLAFAIVLLCGLALCVGTTLVLEHCCPGCTETMAAIVVPQQFLALEALRKRRTMSRPY